MRLKWRWCDEHDDKNLVYELIIEYNAIIEVFLCSAGGAQSDLKLIKCIPHNKIMNTSVQILSHLCMSLCPRFFTSILISLPKRLNEHAAVCTYDSNSN